MTFARGSPFGTLAPLGTTLSALFLERCFLRRDWASGAKWCHPESPCSRVARHNPGAPTQNPETRQTSRALVV
jgi:hypothetical protein